MIKVETIIKTPLESAFFDVAPMHEFAFRFNYKRTSLLNSNLIVAGTAQHWPVWHLTTVREGLRFGYNLDGKWIDVLFPIADKPHFIEGDCFSNVFRISIDGDQVYRQPISLYQIACCGIGAAPLMHGNGVYGDAEIWGVHVDAQPLADSLLLHGQRNTGYDYESVSRIEALLSTFKDPSVLRIDIDGLGEINREFGRPPGDPLLVDCVLGDIQNTILALNSNATAHYQRRDNDEFVVFCEFSDSESLADAILTVIQQSSHRGLPQGRLTASCGIGAKGGKFFGLYAHAGIALRSAKEDGKNCHRTCSGEVT